MEVAAMKGSTFQQRPLRFQFRLRTLMMLTALACVYFGSYRALLTPSVQIEYDALGGAISDAEPGYRIGGYVSVLV